MDRYAVKGDKEWVWPDPSGTCVSVFKNPLAMTYPFVPKSNVSLVPGHFWGFELPSGRWAAGRVVGLGPKSQAGRSSMIAGTHDWVGVEPPTAADIESAPWMQNGAPCMYHVRNISDFTEVLGWASTDGLEYREAWARFDPIERDGVTYDGAVGYLGFPLELIEPDETQRRFDQLDWQQRNYDPDRAHPDDHDRLRDGTLRPKMGFYESSVSLGGLHYAAMRLDADEFELSRVDRAVYLTLKNRRGTIYGEVTPEQIAESTKRLDAIRKK